MLRLGLLTAVAVTLLCLDARAAGAPTATPRRAVPAAPSTTRCTGVVRWTSEAVLDLALVRRGAIERNEGQCPEPGGFHAAGKRFAAIDRWGRTVGVVENRNDETHGMDFRTLAGSRGVHVFVDAVVPKRKSAEWIAPRGERATLLRALGIAAPRDVAFFHGGTRELAVVLDRSAVVIAERLHGRWQRIHREQGTVASPISLRAIVDMNGDGMPEIIVHVGRDAMGYEAVLSAKGAGFRRVTDNEDTGP